MVHVRYLLDTHTLIWAITDHPNLSEQARSIIINPKNEIFVSPVSAWEIAIKYQIGKLPDAKHLIDNLSRYIKKSQFDILPIQLSHSLAIAELPLHHKDPFDRMLIAQCQIESLCLISKDEVFERYDVRCCW